MQTYDTDMPLEHVWDIQHPAAKQLLYIELFIMTIFMKTKA